jgi:hypothetical protein
VLCEDLAMVVDNPDEDPGWRMSPRLLLLLVPGYLTYALRRRRSADLQDGLSLLREVWVSFTTAMILFGVVLVFAVGSAPTRPAGGWVVGLAVVAGLCLGAQARFGRRALNCNNLASLAESYRTRFFLRTAFAELIALCAFVATFLVGEWWLYWMYLPFALYGFALNAPTPARVRAEQQQLALAGCQLSLVRALRERRR